MAIARHQHRRLRLLRRRLGARHPAGHLPLHRPLSTAGPGWGNFDNGYNGLDTQASFALRFIGAITMSVAGSYQFRVGVNDGAIVKVNGAQVVATNAIQVLTFATSSAITYAAGNYPIEVQYFQAWNHSALILYWNSVNGKLVTGSYVPVPPSAYCNSPAYAGDDVPDFEPPSPPATAPPPPSPKPSE